MCFFEEFFTRDKDYTENSEYCTLKATMRGMFGDLAGVFGPLYRKDIGEASAYLRESSPAGQLNCYQVVCLFLFFVSRYSSQNVFKEMLLLLSNLLNLANNGWSQYEPNLGFPTGQNQMAEPYCLRSDLAHFPELATAYLLHRYPGDVPASVSFLNQKNSVYPNMYGIDKINVIRTVTFLRLMSRWLLIYGFTTSVLFVSDCPKLTADFLKTKSEI